MKNLIDTYKNIQRQQPKMYIRDWYKTFIPEHRFAGIVGPRGIGKTTFLLYYLREKYNTSEEALYISADDMYFADHSLLDTAQDFVTFYGGKLLCIDEIHKYPNWNQELKNMYDSFPQLSVLFSGSSSLDLVHGKYDLSRRALLYHMHGLSFREYLEIKTGNTYKTHTLKEIVKKDWYYPDAVQTPKLLGHLRDYIKSGYFPCTWDVTSYNAYKKIIFSMLEKTIYQDVSSFYSIHTGNLNALKRIVYFFATIPPGKLNVHSLARSIGMDDSTIAHYIQILQETGLLRYLLNDAHGHKYIRNAEKIYVENPNLLCAINDTIGKQVNKGTMRELFVIQQLQNAGYTVSYSEKGDISCEGSVFEIGGKNKTRKQLKGVKNGYVVEDEILNRFGTSIPLWAFGFLY